MWLMGRNQADFDRVREIGCIEESACSAVTIQNARLKETAPIVPQHEA